MNPFSDLILNENGEAQNIKTEQVENLKSSFDKDELASKCLTELDFDDSQNYLNEKDGKCKLMQGSYNFLDVKVDILYEN